VLDNVDPLELNRLLVEVPTLPAVAASFALPSSPYGGLQVGLVLTPPIGANVWVSFENGDPAYPVWVGCFWTEGQKPLLAETPTQQLLCTGSINAMVEDLPGAGEILVTATEPGFSLPITASANSELLSLTVGEAVASASAEEASLLLEPTSLLCTSEGLVVEAPGAVEVAVPALSVEGDLDQAGALQIEGDVENAGAVEVEGNVELAGALEIEGELNQAGAVEVEGDVEVAGAVEVEGDVAVVGAIEVAGDVAVAGACEVLGDASVIGVVDGVGEVAVVGAVEVAGVMLSTALAESIGNFW